MSSGGVLPSALTMGLGRAASALGLVNSTSGYTGMGGQGTALGEVGLGVGAASSALSALAGFRRGGVIGDLQGVSGSVSAISLADRAAGGAGLGPVGAAAGYLGAGIQVYEFAKNWQSGKTGAEALQGAETGASIGTLVNPGLGTLVGGVIGGAVGALSSAFGGGAKDPETQSSTALDAQVAKATKAGASPAQIMQALSGMSPQMSVQYLAGVMDARGTETGLESVFGRMGESNLMQQMGDEINVAVKSGKIAGNATADQMYSQIVAPWLKAKGAGIGVGATLDAKGASTTLPLQAAITSLIGQWQSGNFNKTTPVGVSGENIPIANYAGWSPDVVAKLSSQYQAAHPTYIAGYTKGVGGRRGQAIVKRSVPGQGYNPFGG